MNPSSLRRRELGAGNMSTYPSRRVACGLPDTIREFKQCLADFPTRNLIIKNESFLDCRIQGIMMRHGIIPALLSRSTTIIFSRRFKYGAKPRDMTDQTLHPMVGGDGV